VRSGLIGAELAPPELTLRDLCVAGTGGAIERSRVKCLTGLAIIPREESA